MQINFTCLFLLLTVSCFNNGAANEKLGRRNSVPVAFVRGTHYEVGFDVGRTFASLIENFVNTFEGLHKFEREYQTDVGRNAYEKTLTNMRKRYPYYVKEMQGIADGAKVPFQKLFLLQMDDIIDTINENEIYRNDTGGCSSIGINRPQNNILGHTEDARHEILNNIYIMVAHIIPSAEDIEQGAKEERFASLCYAGHLPGYTMGYNENGLVYSINTLSPKLLKPGGTPRTFITRALLAARDYSEAEKVLLDSGLGTANGFSLNMIWTTANGQKLTNIEIAPDYAHDQSMLNINHYKAGGESLVHCNKYQRLSVKEVDGGIIDSSVWRLNSISKHSQPRSRKDVEDILSDTSGETYRVFQAANDAFIKTVAAGIFDLQQMTWSIYIEKPNANEPVAILPIIFKKA